MNALVVPGILALGRLLPGIVPLPGRLLLGRLSLEVPGILVVVLSLGIVDLVAECPGNVLEVSGILVLRRSLP